MRIFSCLSAAGNRRLHTSHNVHDAAAANALGRCIVNGSHVQVLAVAGRRNFNIRLAKGVQQDGSGWNLYLFFQR